MLHNDIVANLVRYIPTKYH